MDKVDVTCEHWVSGRREGGGDSAVERMWCKAAGKSAGRWWNGRGCGSIMVARTIGGSVYGCGDDHRMLAYGFIATTTAVSRCVAQKVA